MRSAFLIPFSLSLVLVASGCDSTSSSQAPTEQKSAEAQQFQATWDERVAAYEAAIDDYSRVLALHAVSTWWVEIQKNGNVYTMKELDLAGWAKYIVEHANAEIARITPKIPAQIDPALIDVDTRPTVLTRAMHYAIFNVGFYENYHQPELRPSVDEMGARLTAMIADDGPYDTKVIPAFTMDAAFLFQVAYGREATQKACRAALDRLDPKSPHPRNVTIWVCVRAIGNDWRDDVVAWVPEEDIKEFEKEWAGKLDAKIAAEGEAVRAEGEAAMAQMDADLAKRRQEEEDFIKNGYSDASSSSSSGSSEAASGSNSVNYTIKNSCGASVKLAFANGDPKFKSSSTLGLSANQQTRNSSKPGQQIWIVDGSGNGIASTSVSDSTRTVEITGSSCNSISAK